MLIEADVVDLRSMKSGREAMMGDSFKRLRSQLLFVRRGCRRSGQVLSNSFNGKREQQSPSVHTLSQMIDSLHASARVTGPQLCIFLSVFQICLFLKCLSFFPKPVQNNCVRR